VYCTSFDRLDQPRPGKAQPSHKVMVLACQLHALAHESLTCSFWALQSHPLVFYLFVKVLSCNIDDSTGKCMSSGEQWHVQD